MDPVHAPRAHFALLLVGGLSLCLPAWAEEKDPATELRLSAMIGDTQSVASLLDRGVPVDAPIPRARPP